MTNRTLGKEPGPVSVFTRFPRRLQEAIVSRLGWSTLRPVQEMAGAAILEGKNAVILAPTAGGKTEAAVFPTLAGLMEQEPEGVGALYIAPIKALLNNQEERLGAYAEMVGLRSFVWHGDTKASRKRAFLKEPAELLLTTPESLEVMLLSPRVPAEALFRDLRVIIVDEVHALAGTDRGAHLMSVIERLLRFTRNDVQRVGLSATVGNPQTILKWLKGTSRRRGVVVDPPREPTQRQLLVALREDVKALSAEAGRLAVGKKSFFFCESRALSERVAEAMRGRGVDVFVHHSSVSLEERLLAEARFQHGQNACIVCTSTLELGIDVGDLDRVFQANAPSTVSSFLQRMGRTGRRPGQKPNTTFLCEHPEAVLQAVALIELARAQWVESVPTQRRCWPVLVHQLFALTLQHSQGIRAEECWQQLCRVPDFRGIEREEFFTLVEHMKREDYLFETGGLLSMGQRAEKVFGKKNFSELYAVFSSPSLYRVFWGKNGRELGSLEQSFVDRLEEGLGSFLLAGRAWQVEHIDHRERVVKVREAPGGQRPSWGGFIPQLLGFALCQRIKRVLTEEEEYRYTDEAAVQAIKAQREDLGPLLKSARFALQREGESIRWWTFAGGRINHTLKYGIACLQDWKVVADNFHLRIEGENLTFHTLEAVLERMAQPDFWEAETTRQTILRKLPEYRLSKFQKALPEKQSIELVGSYLLDIPGAKYFLSGQRPPEEPEDEAPEVEEEELAGDVLAGRDAQKGEGALLPQREEQATLSAEGTTSLQTEKEGKEGEPGKYITHLPLLTLEAAAAAAEQWRQTSLEQIVEVERWIPVENIGRRLSPEMFVAHIRGHSMDDGKSGLTDGSLAVFEFDKGGSRQNQIVLLQTSRYDPDTGFFAVKKYVADARGAEGEHRWIRLVSLHPDKETYPEILLHPEEEGSVRVIARLIASLDQEKKQEGEGRGATQKEKTPPKQKGERDLQSEEGRQKLRQHMEKAINRFFEAKPNLKEDAPDLSPEALEAWESRLCLDPSDGKGLFLWLSPLKGLPGFARKIRLFAGDFSQLLIGANLKGNACQIPVKPRVENYSFTAEGFEDEEDLQAALDRLTTPGLSPEKPTVFRPDLSGVGHRLEGNTLMPGQAYRVVLPPSLETPPEVETWSLGEGWRVWECLLPQTLSQELRGVLDKLGLRPGTAALSARFMGISPWSYGENGKGERYPRFSLKHDIFVEISAPQRFREGEIHVVVASTDCMIQQALPEGDEWYLALEGLLPGRYVLEVVSRETTFERTRLPFSVEEEGRAWVAAQVIVTLGEDSRPVAESTILEADLASLGEGNLPFSLKLPPLWPVRCSWQGLQNRSFNRIFADEKGDTDISFVFKETRAARQEELLGELLFDLGDLGLLRLQHTREFSSDVFVQHLQKLWSERQGLLSAAAGDFQLLEGQWLSPVCRLLGYRLQKLSGGALAPASAGMTAALLWQAERRLEGVFCQKSRLLVFAPPGSDLRAQGAGSVIDFAKKLCKGQKLSQAILTDGIRWAPFALRKPGGVILDIPRILQPENKDLLDMFTYLFTA